MVIMYYSMFGIVPKSKVMMHPNPGCGIIVTCQMRPFIVTVDMQLLVFPRYQ
jgi:hypothetical protein